MLTTCPNCSHVFEQSEHTYQQSSSCFQHTPQSPSWYPASPVVVSATLQLSCPTTCTLSMTTSSAARHRVMAGGGIVSESDTIILQPQQSDVGKCLSQPSPSTPLSFILPTTPAVFTTQAPSLSPLPPWTSSLPFQWPGLQFPPVPPPQHQDSDLVRLSATMKALLSSGWYYEGLSWKESVEALRESSPGTFLVRDSSDPRFLFSLSVQTKKGPTSVRIHYSQGRFRLDAVQRLVSRMPLFENVVELVQYYIYATKDTETEQVWVDSEGHMYSHILLTKPLYKKHQLPTLQHLCRLAINKQTKTSRLKVTMKTLNLPTFLSQFLEEYPYTY